MYRVPTPSVRGSARPPGTAVGEMNPVQGMSWRPNPNIRVSIRCMIWKARSPKRFEPLGAASWRRRPGSSPRAGKPSTWRSGPGRRMVGSGGSRHARRRNDAGHHSRARQERTSPGGRLPTALQPGPLPEGLWADLTKRRGAHRGGLGGDRGRDVPGEDRDTHRSDSTRAVPMDSGPTHPHPQGQWENEAARHPHVVGQAAARGHALPPGGVLRAAVQRPLPPGPARHFYDDLANSAVLRRSSDRVYRPP